jgi:tripeptidyl-peptidase-1
MIEIGESNYKIRNDYNIGDIAPLESNHIITIAIKNNNVEIMKDKLLDISDPTSYNYGKYLTFEEVGDIIRNDASTNIVTTWLINNGCNIIASTINGDYIRVQSTIGKFSTLFDSEFYHFSNNDKIVYRALKYSLPEEIYNHVETILDLIHLPVDIDKKTTISTIEKHDNTISSTAYITPAKLQSYYNIDGIPDSLSTQSIFATINQTFSPDNLELFQSHFNLPSNPITTNIGGHSSSNLCQNLNNVNQCVEANLDVQYITAMAAVPTQYHYVDENYGFSSNVFLNWAINVSNTVDPPLVHSISYGQNELYVDKSEMNQFDVQLIQFGLMGLTVLVSSGDDGAPSSSNDYTCAYLPIFPASSAYVTAVGATQGVETNSPEIVCAANTGSSITSGGGFSNLSPMPSWQKNAVDDYLNKYNPQNNPTYPTLGEFNASGRAYPDISMSGNSYYVIIGEYIYSVAGTSASSPVIAGLVSLVNSYRLQKGFSPVGFLNPAIYGNNGEFANDITSGDNKCKSSASNCCSIGFEATEGYDPVTGFGSLNYQRFASYFSSEIPGNSSTYPSQSPSQSPTDTSSVSSLFDFSSPEILGIFFVFGIILFCIIIGFIRMISNIYKGKKYATGDDVIKNSVSLSPIQQGNSMVINNNLNQQFEGQVYGQNNNFNRV